ncbi:MAG TPA: TIGR03118 family protein [Planctomycetaceae bacterium]
MKFRIAAGIALLSTAAMAAQEPRGDYHIVPLVSDQKGVAPDTDPDLVNAWGISQAPGSPLWVSDNGTNLSTLYDPKSGEKNSLVVKLPSGGPTGTVFVNGKGFPISENGMKGDSVFIFDTEDGALLGWNNSVDLNKAIVAVDNSRRKSAYKGLALDDDLSLFAADFVNNEVQIYDRKWHLTGRFTDTYLPKRFAPFNSAWIKGKLYVAFAKREMGGIDEVDGKGLGYVDVFDANGNLQKQLIAQGDLNAPWGMTIAPPKFGKFAGALLVGNFGDGKVHAYDVDTGKLLGTLRTNSDKTLVIDGLWSLFPGPDKRSVIFSSGPDGEKHGLLGQIRH